MPPLPKFPVQERDLYADLDFVECLLAHALLLPRQPSDALRRGRDALEKQLDAATAELSAQQEKYWEARAHLPGGDDAALSPEDQARIRPFKDGMAAAVERRKEQLSEVAAAMSQLILRELGEHYVELKRLLRQDSEDRTGRRSEVETTLSAYRGRREQLEQWEDNKALSIDNWAGASDHPRCRRRLIDLLISTRSGVWNAITKRKNPDDPESVPSPPAAAWNRTLQGHVSVHAGSLVHQIKREVLVWLFVEVASTKGQVIPWAELIKRRLDFLVREGRAAEGSKLDLRAESMERYGRSVGKQLGRLGIYWVQDANGVCWKGDDPLKN